MTEKWQPPIAGLEPPSVQASLSLAKDATDQQVQELRQLLPAELKTVDDATARRFIRATNGQLPLSAKRLQNTMAWRKLNKPEAVVCTACAKDPRAHYMHVVGYDSLNRPIIYSCLEAAGNKVYQDNVDHMISTFETAIKCMPPGVEQWVWVCDFHGFGVSDANPRLAKAFLDVSAEHYPERLGLFLLVDAPKLFGVLWKAISGFVDPKTYTKIRFLPYDVKQPKSVLKSFLSEHCNESTAKWLVTEMQENRDSKKLALKAYSMTHIHRSASRGDLITKKDDTDHDYRGEDKLLLHFNSAPNLLEPQALHG